MTYLPPANAQEFTTFAVRYRERGEVRTLFIGGIPLFMRAFYFSSIIGGLAEGPFQGLQAWTEVLQDTFLRLFDSGKLDFATATSIRFSPEG